MNLEETGVNNLKKNQNNILSHLVALRIILQRIVKTSTWCVACVRSVGSIKIIFLSLEVKDKFNSISGRFWSVKQSVISNYCFRCAINVQNIKFLQLNFIFRSLGRKIFSILESFLDIIPLWFWTHGARDQFIIFIKHSDFFLEYAAFKIRQSFSANRTQGIFWCHLYFLSTFMFKIVDFAHFFCQSLFLWKKPRDSSLTAVTQMVASSKIDLSDVLSSLV